jgi:hypothetical protein
MTRGREAVMKLRKPILIVGIAVAVLSSASCIELVTSLSPWFDVEDAVDEPLLAGAWCLDDDDGDCSRDERMRFVRGPRNSWNVLVDGKLGFRVWVGDIGETRYLDWMFLCEPSRNAADDNCSSIDFELGNHVVVQVVTMEEDRIEFRLLDGDALDDVLTHRVEPLEYGRTADGLVVVEDSYTLAELLSEHGERVDLWYEETMVMTRVRAGCESR